MVKEVCLNYDRDKNIDTIKGIAIFLVVWGHLIQYSGANRFDFYNDNIFKIIYSFHMPLFMIISGYLFYFSFKKRSWIDLMKNKIKTILKTIVIWNIIRYLILSAVEYMLEGKFSFSVIEMIRQMKGLWFLWAVLICSILVGTIGRCRSNIMEEILLICCMPVIKLLPNEKYVIFVYPFFVLGYLFNKYRNNISDEVIKLRFLTLLIFPVMWFFYEKKHYIYVSGIDIFNSVYGVWGQIEINIFRWIIGLVGSICVITIVQLIFRNKKKYTTSIITKLGTISLQVYVIQSILIEEVYKRVYLSLCNYYDYNVLLGNIIVYDLVITLILTFIFLLVINFLIKLIRKSCIVNNVLFGR